MKKQWYLIALLGLGLTMYSCSSDDTPNNETNTELTLENLPQTTRANLTAELQRVSPNATISTIKEKKASDNVTLRGYVVEATQGGKKQQFNFGTGGEYVSEVIDFEGSSLLTAEVRKAIQAYINSQYPGARILEVEREDGGYEVEILYNNAKYELFFSLDGTFVTNRLDYYNNAQLTASVRSKILNYVTANYPNAYVKDIEREKTGYEVELLVNNVEYDLYFDLNGNFLRQRLDYKNPQQLPATVKANIEAYIQANFPNAYIKSVEMEGMGYEVDIIHDGWEYELNFDANGNFTLYKMGDDYPANLTAEVLEIIQTYISKNYPNARLIAIEAEGNGYEVDIIYNRQEWELTFDSKGNFLRAERDD